MSTYCVLGPPPAASSGTVSCDPPSQWLWEGGSSVRMFTDERLRSGHVCFILWPLTQLRHRRRSCVGSFGEGSPGDCGWRYRAQPGEVGEMSTRPAAGRQVCVLVLRACQAEGTACAKAQRQDPG